MRKSKGSEYRQSYNGQAAVSVDGSQLIVGARLTDAASDRRELVATVDAVPPVLGRVGCVLADSGYANGAEVEVLRKQTVEPVFGIIKEAMGFRRFLLRGLEKVRGEWQLVCLAYNCRRLHRLMQAM